LPSIGKSTESLEGLKDPGGKTAVLSRLVIDIVDIERRIETDEE